MASFRWFYSTLPKESQSSHSSAGALWRGKEAFPRASGDPTEGLPLPPSLPGDSLRLLPGHKYSWTLFSFHRQTNMGPWPELYSQSLCALFSRGLGYAGSIPQPAPAVSLGKKERPKEKQAFLASH